ncbi:hypothetical protein [Stenotrophomonas maltophilia]|uniref:hypothetical protein n=1 Tax=Stenotrophomonas maltophilia TaxID=40324 RepID=UPI00201D18C0|nr:hypothetical protein [Stenotrophomonas maltophilia]UQY97360.1 hypothetical protein LZ605_08360 [Stenotrophomonas maltophilia]
MTAPVDVLAVLDTLCERAASGDPAEYREVNSLRYAFTELIEAARVARMSMQHMRGPESIIHARTAELDAALARVKGAAA